MWNFEDLLEVGRDVLVIVVAGAAVATGASFSAKADELKQGAFLIDRVAYGDHVLRTGLYLEQGPMKGCVLYLEGLGDSIQNHEPLFNALANAGYRTITFDYYGQGGWPRKDEGSSGTMSETRLEDAKHPQAEIGSQAKFIWNHFSQSSADPVRGLSCASSKKFVIGWSTGGLAAYILASQKWPNAVALLAPGLKPKTWVGESQKKWPKMLTPAGGDSEGKSEFKIDFFPVISMRSLTRAKFEESNDPHVDMIHPTNPLNAFSFAINLYWKSKKYSGVRIDPSVRGLALLSGDEDSYVDRAATVSALKANTQFAIKSYPGALHELDNEIEPVAADVRSSVIEFFNSAR